MDRYLADSGVLLRFFAEEDPQHSSIVTTVQRLFKAGTRICFTPQVAREVWSVFTRPPEVGGYGLSPDAAEAFLERAHQVFEFAPDCEDIYTIWRALVKTYAVSGRQVHDAYHVAAMIAHGISRALTLDERDFVRYVNIETVCPRGA